MSLPSQDRSIHVYMFVSQKLLIYQSIQSTTSLTRRRRRKARQTDRLKTALGFGGGERERSITCPAQKGNEQSSEQSLSAFIVIIHTYIHICINNYLYIYMYTVYVYNTHIPTYIYVYAQVNTYICTYLYEHVNIYCIIV